MFAKKNGPQATLSNNPFQGHHPEHRVAILEWQGCNPWILCIDHDFIITSRDLNSRNMSIYNTGKSGTEHPIPAPPAAEIVPYMRIIFARSPASRQGVLSSISLVGDGS
jgi:hypothetical protein